MIPLLSSSLSALSARQLTVPCSIYEDDPPSTDITSYAIQSEKPLGSGRRSRALCNSPTECIQPAINVLTTIRLNITAHGYLFGESSRLRYRLL